MSPLTPDDLDNLAAQNGKPRKGGKLPWMPDWEAPLPEQRQWLNLAFNPRNGAEFDNIVRHGRGLSDPADVIFRAPAGNVLTYRFPEQRALAKPTNLRSSIVALTDGMCRPPHMTPAEAGDVWAMICTVAAVDAEQDAVADFAEDLEHYLRVCETEGRYSLTQPYRYDALLALRARGTFERRHASLMASVTDEHQWTRRPIMLIDKATKDRWIRVGELGVYLRHVVSMQLGRGMLDGRMAELGHQRFAYEERRGADHPKASLYQLLAPEPASA